MKMKHLYLAMCVLGIILPYYFMAQFFIEMGTDYNLIIDWIFVNNWNSFFLMDLFITAVVAIIFMVREGRRLGMEKLWLPLISVGLVGICLALPLFLYMREVHLEKDAEEMHELKADTMVLQEQAKSE